MTRCSTASRSVGIRAREAVPGGAARRGARRRRGRSGQGAAVRRAAGSAGATTLSRRCGRAPTSSSRRCCFDGRRFGYADFLRRVPRPSDLGDWSYEVWDTKLARHAKASAVLQLCLYSDMVSDLQGRTARERCTSPSAAWSARRSPSASPTTPPTTGSSRATIETFLESGGVFPLEGAPEPVEHCGVCRWSERCRKQWRDEDDLSLVAGLSSRQRRALNTIDVTTRTGLAEPAEPLPDRLDGAGPEALARIEAQAEIQVRGERSLGRRSPSASSLRATARTNWFPTRGCSCSPSPPPGDLFFDIEGDPFFESDEVDGIDYLFGVIEPVRPDQPTGSRRSTPSGRSRTAPSPRARNGAPSRPSSTSSRAALSRTQTCTSTTTRPTSRPP